jgi:rare lipoprotein A (peptidoglycan hydrolase)
MVPQRKARFGFALAIAVCVLVPSAMPAAAEPSTAQTSADRAELARAIGNYEEALARSEAVNGRLNEASATLDQIVAEANRRQEWLRSRVVAMYRASDCTTISLLLGSSSVQELTARLDLLSRMARRDAENIEALKAAHAEAKRSAEALMELQTEQARVLDELAQEVARAKKDLAASEAALREYLDKVEASTRSAAVAATPTPAVPTDSNQQLTGSGEWLTAVASHYGRNFTGRGANGEAIGPYSMIVAHMTLPFGTLVEFEYNGRRAVAKVADRGPNTPGRDFDLGPGVVRTLDFSGVHEISYRVIGQ